MSFFDTWFSRNMGNMFYFCMGVQALKVEQSFGRDYLNYGVYLLIVTAAHKNII